MRKFEKISFEQFVKDVKDDRMLYESIELPARKTKASAGYDFIAMEEFSIEPGEIKKIPTGVKVVFPEDEVLMLFVRGSMGFKWNVRLCNQVGIIDSDYYNNPDNEGHMWIRLENQGDKDYVVKKGDKICQGIFMNFLTTDNEENIENVRTSGFGSTDKKGND